jgi:hypothetical protein
MKEQGVKRAKKNVRIRFAGTMDLAADGLWALGRAARSGARELYEEKL